MSNFLPISVRPRETPCDLILSAIDTSSVDRFIMPILTAFPSFSFCGEAKSGIWKGKKRKKSLGNWVERFLIHHEAKYLKTPPSEPSSYKDQPPPRQVSAELRIPNPLGITRYHSTTAPLPGMARVRENDAIFLEKDEHKVMFFLIVGGSQSR